MSANFGMTTGRRRHFTGYAPHPIPEAHFARPGVVQDVLAYLLIALNPWDDRPFRRIGNKPQRGIGPVLKGAVVDHATRFDIAYYEALFQIAGAMPSGSVLRSHLDRLADCLSLLALGYSHENWKTEDFVDMILHEEGVGYGKFALGRARSPAAVVSTIEALRGLAAVEKDPILFLERFPPEWRNLPRQV